MAEPERKVSRKAATKKFKCDQCGMVFATFNSITTHKKKFCVGLPNGNLPQKDEEHVEAVTDTVTKSNNKPVDEELTKNDEQEKDNDNEIDRENKVLEDLYNYKSKKSIEQSVKDIEDLIIRDTIRDKQIIDTIQSGTPDLNDSKRPGSIVNDPFKRLFDEYNHLKRKERQMYQHIIDLQQTSTSSSVMENRAVDEPELNNKENDFFLPSIIPNSNSNEQTQMYLKYIQEKAIELEKERRDIQKSLEEIKSDKTLPMQTKQSLSRILAELKDQEDINNTALEILKRRLMKSSMLTTNINNNSINTNNAITNQVSQSPDIYFRKPNENLNLDEIKQIRSNYLQNGGHDKNVLLKLTELEYEARYPKLSDISNPIQTDTAKELTAKVQRIEMENRRLKYEISALQNKYRNLNMTNFQYNNQMPIPFNQRYSFNQIRPPPIVPYQFEKYNSVSLPPLENRQRLNQSYENVPTPRQLQQLQQQQHQQHQLNINPELKPLNSNRNGETNNQDNSNQRPVQFMKISKSISDTIYDQARGFVIFIDFISNLNANNSCCRIVTCLHHPKSGLGEPSILPLVNCETYVENNEKRTTVALVSTKQPVPQCPPQQSLSLLIEVQLADDEINESKLRSCAWIKIPLFNSKNSLISGRWRMPLKKLPISSDVNLININKIENFEHAEIFYRLVHAKDADSETNIPISPIYAHVYNSSPITDELPLKIDDISEKQDLTPSPSQDTTTPTKQQINIVNYKTNQKPNQSPLKSSLIKPDLLSDIDEVYRKKRARRTKNFLKAI